MNSNSKFAQVDDAGIQLIVQFVDQDNVIIDMSSATALKIKLELPDGTTADHTATLLGDGIDGKIYYNTTDTDLPLAGFYLIQGQASIAGNVFSTRTDGFQVYANIDNT